MTLCTDSDFEFDDSFNNTFHMKNMHTFAPIGTPPLSPLTVSRHLSPIVTTRHMLPPMIQPKLPYDILWSIFEFLTLQQLLDVAVACHYFQSVALHAICTRLHYTRGDDFMWSSSEDLPLLRALCRLKWEIPTLTYIFRHSILDGPFVDEVIRVRRYLSHMRQVSPNEFSPQQVIIELCQTTPALFSSLHGRKRHQKRWATSLTELFDDIIMFTKSLTVRCGRTTRPLQRSDVARVAKHLGLVEQCQRPIDPPLSLIGYVRSSLLQCIPHVFAYTTGRCHKGSEMQELPFYVDNGDLRHATDVPRPALTSSGPRTLEMHSPLFFHPALLRWTLELLSTRCKDVTHLSFKNANISRGCWTDIFPHIQAPSLKSFDVDSCTFPTLDVAHFVARNGQLERLTLGPNLMGTHTENEDYRPSWLTLPNITALEATPGCFSRLLFGPDPMSFAPKLERATVFLRLSRDETIVDMDRSLSLVHGRLSGLDITLQLIMESRSTTWFQSQSLLTASLPTAPIRHQMTRLRICADIYRLRSDFWKDLPGWIAEFLPGVKSVAIVERQIECLRETWVMELDVRRSHDVCVLVDGLRRTCPSVLDLQVGDVQHSLEDWGKNWRM